MYVLSYFRQFCMYVANIIYIYIYIYKIFKMVKNVQISLQDDLDKLVK